MFQSFFLNYGNLLGFFLVVIGGMFYAFVQKSFGFIMLLAGGGLLLFFYVL